MSSPLIKFLLTPLSCLYGLLTTLRNFLFDLGVLKRQRVTLPVVSVGNITAGGSGKSPFARYVCEYLLSRGMRPVILSRGYGGEKREPYLVTEKDLASAVGDEPLMQKQYFGDKVNVVVSPRRVEGARLIEEMSWGDVIVMDDAYQHRYLERDFNILMLDITSQRDLDSVLAGHLLPVGSLREHAKRALKRADAVVLVRREGSEAKDAQIADIRNWANDVPTFEFILDAESFVDVFNGERCELDALSHQPLTAVAAIGKPDSFFRLLESKGLRLEKRESFRDHYSFSEKDWEGLISNTLVCTEKDAVKLRSFASGESQAFYLLLKGELRGAEKFMAQLNEISARN